MEATEKLFEIYLKPYEAKIAQLEQTIIDLRKQSTKPMRSEIINDLAAALAKAQGEMKVAGLNQVNPYFKNPYGDLEAVVQASRAALTKHGLSVSQVIMHYEDGVSMLHTILFHTTGQYLESRMRIVPSKNDIQTITSHTNNIKRLAYSSLIGCVIANEDDDGEGDVAETRETFAKGVALNTKYNPKDQSPEVIGKDQLEDLEYELSGYPDIAEMILEGLKLRSIADMPKKKYHSAITRIREIKNLRNGK